MFIPYQAVMIPLLQLLLELQVPSGIPSLILVHVIYGIPITTLIFRNYYESVPRELGGTRLAAAPLGLSTPRPISRTRRPESCVEPRTSGCAGTGSSSTS
ncbi:hypothetical protein [Georgenia sp. SUBG003]|uniref:hypothetical protein n=1 Tax=Georgenia sp. SUBG003 TaxID=1497974 RepID=UPI003AB70AD8